MNIASLQPAGSLAQRFGIKAVIYGKAGTAKTPSLNSAPNVVMLATEPGLLSMRGSTIPTWEAPSIEKISEFFNWFFGSAESKKFDTLAIDSGSQLAEIYLTYYLAKCKDGRKAYGEMSMEVMKWFTQLYYMPQKHIIMICKEMQAEVGKQMVNQGGVFSVEMVYQAQPYFPGKDLNIKVPHLYDQILYASKANIPNVGIVPTLRTVGTPEIYARDRSGRLAELEPLNWSALISKVMS